MTIKELRAICQGSSKSPSLASQTLWGRLNRIVSIYLTAIFIHLPFTPNQITVFGTAVFLIGCGLFAFGAYTLNLIGWACIALSFLLDAVDGELARYRNVMKKYDVGGVYVEPVSHDVQYGFMMLPIGFGAYLTHHSILPLIAAFLATTTKLLFRLLEFRLQAVMRHIDEVRGTTYGWSRGFKTPHTWSYFIYRNTFVITGMIPLLLLAVVARHVDYFVYFYGVSLPLLWLFIFRRHLKRIWKEARE